MAEQVRPRPDQPERAQAGRVPGIERIEIGIDRLRALDVDLDREGAVRHRPLDVGNRADDANRTFARALEAEQPAQRGQRKLLRMAGRHHRRHGFDAAVGVGDWDLVKSGTSSVSGTQIAKKPPISPLRFARGRVIWKSVVLFEE